MLKASAPGPELLEITEKIDFPFISRIFGIISSTPLFLAGNSALALVFGFLLFRAPVIPELLLACSLVTLGVYGLNKLTDRIEDEINCPRSSFSNPKGFLFLYAGSMLLGLLIGSVKGLFVFACLIVPILVGIVYSIRIFRGVPRIKELLGAKSVSVALTWALTGCLIPLSVYSTAGSYVWVVFAYFFIKVFVGTILGDLKDVDGDRFVGAVTIPIRFGKIRTKKFLIAVNTSCLVPISACLVIDEIRSFAPAMFFGLLFGYFCIWYFYRYNSKNFLGSFMLDIEWLPIILLAIFLG